MNQQTTRAQSATEILRTAASTLGERGKQYDPNGKQERSMTAIVAAFNAIYPRNLLTVHMGWQFMSLVKMVRGATKPHADSALDQVAYAALAAECVAEQLHQPESAETMHPDSKRCPDCKTAQAADMETCWQCGYSWKVYVPEGKNSEAMHEEVTRLRGKVQELADLAEYRDKRNMELCAELSRAQDEIQSLLAEKRNLTARNKELEDKVQSLNNEVEAKVRELMSNLRHEAPCAHNTDEPKAPRPEYVDPFDQYGDMRSPMHRLVGSLDPARGGLAYQQGKDAPTPL